MKKSIVLFLSFILTLALCTPAFAAGANVRAPESALSTEESALIEVSLSGNPGIMGFKIKAAYDTDKVELLSVSKGTLTAKGSFNTNINTNTGEVTVLWNHTGEVKGDGSLFILAAKAKKAFGSAKIRLSFSQEDTFNEAFEDVALTCADIVITCGKAEEPTTAPTTQSKEPVQNENGSNIAQDTAANSGDAAQTLTVIDLALTDSGYLAIEEVPENDNAFIDKVNQNASLLQTGEAYTSVEEIQDAYEEAFSEQYAETVVGLTDHSQVEAAVKSALKQAGAATVEELSPDQKQVFVEAFEKEMAAVSEDIPSLTEKVNTQTAVEAIQKAAQKSAEAQKSPAPSPKKPIWLIILTIVAVTGIIIVIVFIKRKPIHNNQA